MAERPSSILTHKPTRRYHTVSATSDPKQQGGGSKVSSPLFDMLYGLIALQNNFVSREELVAAVSAWLCDKSRPLDEILRQRGAIAEDEHQLVAALVRKHLSKHGGNVEQSLAALGHGRFLGLELGQLEDSDIQRTLALVAHRDDAPVDPAAQTLAVAATGSPGMRFHILRPHARGGLGQVFVAHDKELNRQVALKEIQPQHADNPEMRSRFLLEAEITGRLEHPGIVPVYSLSSYPDGRPYYAMRFIEGESLKQAADQFHEQGIRGTRDYHSVTFRQLLGRIIDVCHAVEYAHRRGVLHRDLKPDNMMLGKFGETLVVDWGLAKVGSHCQGASANVPVAVFAAQGSSSGATQWGTAIGTPAFMSPEQAAGKLDELGPTSDVYSLGATLYYVLTGKPPYKAKDLAELLQDVQAGRIVPPRRRQPKVPPGLEAICLKAMRTRPSERYASAAELAEDLERYLAEEPLRARRDPWIVRLRRWLRKHPRAAGILATSLCLGLLTALVVKVVVLHKNRQLAAAAARERQLRIEAQHARDAAVEAEKQAERDRKMAVQQEAIARQNEAEVRAVLEFLEKHVLAASRPAGQDGGLGINVTVRDALGVAEAEVDQAFANFPLIEAELRNALGKTFYYLGEYHRAVQHYRRAIAILEDSLSKDHQETLTVKNNLAVALRSSGQWKEATEILERVVAVRKTTLGPHHADTLQSLNNLAAAYKSAGQWYQAAETYQQVYQYRKNALGDNHPDTLLAANNLAALWVAVGRAPEAIRLLEAALAALRAQYGENHPHTLAARSNLAVAQLVVGQLDQAIAILASIREARVATLGADHPEAVCSLYNLGEGYLLAGRWTEAMPLFEEVWAKRKNAYGEEHPETLQAAHNVALTWRLAGRLSEAIDLYRQVLDQQRQQLGPAHPDTLRTIHDLALAYRAAEQWSESLSLLEEAFRLRETALGRRHPDTLSTMCALIEAKLSADEQAAVVGLTKNLSEALSEVESLPVATMADVVHLGEFLVDCHHFAVATPLLEVVVARCKLLPANVPSLLRARSALGAALVGMATAPELVDSAHQDLLFARAEQLLKEAYQLGQEPSPAISRAEMQECRIRAAARLVNLYYHWKKGEPMRLWQDALRRERLASLDSNPPADAAPNHAPSP